MVCQHPGRRRLTTNSLSAACWLLRPLPCSWPLPSLPSPLPSWLQTDINDKMRAILIDWLVDVHLKFKVGVCLERATPWRPPRGRRLLELTTPKPCTSAA